MRRDVAGFVLLAVFMVLGSGSRADEIRLKDGSLIKGRLIKEVPSESYTVLRADGSENTFAADQVESITHDPAPAPEAEGLGHCVTLQ